MTADETKIIGEVIGRLAAVENRLDRLETKVDRILWTAMGLMGAGVIALVVSIVRQAGA